MVTLYKKKKIWKGYLKKRWVLVSITISTSDSLDIDNTYIETPTVTAIPANIILVRTLMWSRLYINSHCFQPSDSWGKFSWGSHQNSEECARNELHTLNTRFSITQHILMRHPAKGLTSQNVAMRLFMHTKIKE